MKIAELFHKRPIQWGLRGDPHLWAEMVEYFKEIDAPGTEEELRELIEGAYQKLTGKPITQDEHFFMERHSHGGMSSGLISPEFWKERGIPLILESFRDISHS